MSPLDLVIVAASWLGMPIERVANDMTYRQLYQVASIYMRDKMFVVSSLLGAILPGRKAPSGDIDAPEDRRPADVARKYPRGPDGLPLWFKGRRHGGKVVVADVDGSLDRLREISGHATREKPTVKRRATRGIPRGVPRGRRRR